MKTTMTRKFTRIAAAVLAAAAITVSAATTSVFADKDDTAYDSKFLNDMGSCPDRWGDLYTFFHWSEVSGAVDKAWAEVGVQSVTCLGDDNKDYLDGKEITRQEAYEHAAMRAGKDYDYNNYVDAYYTDEDQNKRNNSDEYDDSDEYDSDEYDPEE
mgnify:CR=1 FL=1